MGRSGGTSEGPRRLSYVWRSGYGCYFVHLRMYVNVMLCAVCACPSVRDQSHGDRCHFLTRARAHVRILTHVCRTHVPDCARTVRECFVL